jgi:hypothetical protein
MCGGEPLRNAAELVAYLNKHVDGCHSDQDRVDSVGAKYLGLTSILVDPKDVHVPSVTYKRLDGTRSLHQVVTTQQDGVLLVRNRGCLSCDPCQTGDFQSCINPDADPMREWTMVKEGVTITANRTRQNLQDRRSFLANLACEGSFVAVSVIGEEALHLLNVTKVDSRIRQMINQWLRQYDEQQMTDNNMITIDDMT